MKRLPLLVFFTVLFSFTACEKTDVKVDPAQIIPLEPTERLIGILGTNDIHGVVESEDKMINGKLEKVGGLAIIAGVAEATRKGIKAAYGNKGGVLLLDGGDQFQGTLLSNYDEGDLVFKSMELAKYDAVVPGNHDYDFGPEGWLDDKVSDATQDKDPRGVIKKLIKSVKFPLLSANTYLVKSLIDQEGSPVKVNQSGCSPVNKNQKVDYSKAEMPDFLKPYIIKQVAGVNVALIGLDHPQTGTMTTPENVSDYCFRDMLQAYEDVVSQIGNSADVFILVTHYGNAGADKGANDVILKISNKLPNKIHAVVAGHTHQVNKENINGIPLIQSGAGAEMFGRIALIWNTQTKKMNVEKMKIYAGLKLFYSNCDQEAKFCQKEKGITAHDGFKILPMPSVVKLVQASRDKLDVLAKRKVGDADGKITRNRTDESSMANGLTDAIREVSGADVAIINAGGIRDDFGPGEIKYEELFKVMPFANRGVVAFPMETSRLVSLMKRSIMTCGSFGALMQSGLRVKYKRDCSKVTNGIDNGAELTEIATLSGEVVYQSVPNKVLIARDFKVATLDFLMAGGSGFDGFKGVPLIQDLGIMREILAEFFFQKPGKFSSKTDGRYLNIYKP